MNKKNSIISLIALLCCSCSPTIDSRGYNPETPHLDQIKPGVNSKEEVQQILGSPSTVSSFPEQTWYYISKKTSTTSFFHPTVLEEQIVVINFDERNIVQDVKKYVGEDAKHIQPIKRKTESKSYESSVFRDVFGNFGKYSNKDPNKQS